MGLKLTARMEAFAQGIVSGKTQYQSYIDAGYKVEGHKRAYIDDRASKLARQPKIIQRVAELNEAINKERIKALAWNRDRAAHELLLMINAGKSDIAKRGYRASTSNAVVNAIRELNELDGVKAASQVNFTGGVPVKIVDDIGGEADG
ncbi:MAG: hypothetical protein E6276_05230 [Clostridiales bacterium]|nr:hypothetical protein [Peptococcus niger]MDU7244777.1 hypothetical protein [Clostridiales bacterium]